MSTRDQTALDEAGEGPHSTQDLTIESTPPTISKGASPKVKTLVLGISMSCVFVAATTSLNYMTTFFPAYSAIILCLYGVTFALIGIPAPVLSMIFSVHAMLIFCTFCILIFVGLALFVLILVRNSTSTPTAGVVLLFVGGIFLGMGSGLIWAAWSEFMEDISTNETRGGLSGLFYSIYYLSTPVGNGLSSLLFAVGFEKWQVVLVLTVFCAVGVIVMFFVPSGQCSKKNASRNADIDLAPRPSKSASIKQYFKNLIGWTKKTAPYPVILGYILYHTIAAFIQASFTQQIPEKQGSTFIGVAFAISGVLAIVGSIVFGEILDRRSKRASIFLMLLSMLLMVSLAQITLLIPQETHGTARLVMFIITIAVYGWEQTGHDVNNFSIVVALSGGDPISFFQYTRIFGYTAYGIIALFSDQIAKQPTILVIALVAVLFLYSLAVWNVDTHKVSLSGYVKAIENTPQDAEAALSHRNTSSAELSDLESIYSDSEHRHSSQKRQHSHRRRRSRKAKSEFSSSGISESESGGDRAGRIDSFLDLPEQTPGQLQKKLERRNVSSSPTPKHSIREIDSKPLLGTGRSYKSQSQFSTRRRAPRSHHSSHSSSSHSIHTPSIQQDKQIVPERASSFFFARPSTILSFHSPAPHPNMPQQPMPVAGGEEGGMDGFGQRTQSGVFRGREGTGLSVTRLYRSQINMNDVQKTERKEKAKKSQSKSPGWHANRSGYRSHQSVDEEDDRREKRRQRTKERREGDYRELEDGKPRKHDVEEDEEKEEPQHIIIQPSSTARMDTSHFLTTVKE
ncbi:hypothetical protein BLNAU_13402 [Blattamonas nauphoetae]|uniref:Major facilitator superfamily (MFS) profile domain-containing protein n=1 Tax=Blattamonas nauphoetae TaxID=2049346 RepID=A0ABQ9XJZ1_9EUKA|nr:hypothetical protein BLNAU_13402 [Blattamonas nauphoetae]